MKKLLLFLCLQCYFLTLTAQDFYDRFEYYGKLYEYTVGKGIATDKLKLTIKEADRLDVNERVFLTTYNASIQLLDTRTANNLYKIKIFYAEKVTSYAWRDFPNDFLEISFDLNTKKISYKTNGTRMAGRQTENPEAEIVDSFGEFSEAFAEEIAVDYLIVHYGKLFASPSENTETTATVPMDEDKELMDRFEYFGKLYEYTIGAGNFTSKRKLTIKQADRLEIQDRTFTTVYNSSMVMEDLRKNKMQFSVKIFYAEAVNSYSWRDFPNDYLLINFDFVKNTITYTVKGTKLAGKMSQDSTYEMPTTFVSAGFTSVFAEEIAIDYLIINYGTLFHK